MNGIERRRDGEGEGRGRGLHASKENTQWKTTVAKEYTENELLSETGFCLYFIPNLLRHFEKNSLLFALYVAEAMNKIIFSSPKAND